MNPEISILWNRTLRACELTSRIFVDCEPEQTFSFFCNAGNLESLTPAWLRFEIESPLPSEIRTGTLIRYRLRLHGVPFRWCTEIAEWDPPHSFADHQLHGPFRRWEHHHKFTPAGSGTVVEDRVLYQVPLGRIVNRLFVERDVRRIFEYRQSRLPMLLRPATELMSTDRTG